MWQTADDFDGLIVGSLRNSAGKPLPDGLDQVQREIGKITERFVFDLSTFPISAAQKVSLVDLPIMRFGDSGYVHATPILSTHARIIARIAF